MTSTLSALRIRGGGTGSHAGPNPDQTSPASSGMRTAGRAIPEPDFGPIDSRRDWIATGVIALLALITRFVYLSSVTDKGTPVFDEKHYAPQSFNIVQLGIEENPAYGLVVHPPVAKQIESIGGFLFGYTPLGWRFTAALSGVLIIVMVMRIVRRLSRSTQLGLIAGLLLTVDGMLFVTSRIGMLDIYQVLFVTAAAGALLVDRDRMRERMHYAALAGKVGLSDFGPRLGYRWWRFAAGIMLGLSMGVKWSGLYFIAFFGLMSVMWDLALRKRYGVRRPVVGTLLRDTFPALGSLLALPVVIYFLSWLPWFANENAVYRHVVGNQIPAEGFLPDSIRSWLYFQDSVLNFHASLTNSAGNRHPWESKPWTWPMSLRPMMYYVEQGQDATGCGADSCIRAIMLIGTPALWWLAIPVLGWAFWRAVICRDGRYAFALVGYCAGLVPWFFQFDRQMYFFYASIMVPFYVMLVALILGEILGKQHQSARRKQIGLIVVCVYVAVVIANFVYFWPILTGWSISDAAWNQRLWLPSWR